MDQGRTFYNDHTPPPSPSYGHSRNSFSTGYPASKAHGGSKSEEYDYRYDHVAPPAPIPSREGSWWKRRWFWIILGVAVVVILALGIGLGVGLSQNKDSSDGSSGGQDRYVICTNVQNPRR
jgi:hypothetical protein